MVPNPHLIHSLTQTHVDDLRRQARAQRRPAATSRLQRSSRDEAITIRLANPDDHAALARLAALDSATVPAAPVLIAEANAQARAALSLRDGAAVANPFHPSTAVLELLYARADQLRGDRRPRRVGLRRRFALRLHTIRADCPPETP